MSVTAYWDKNRLKSSYHKVRERVLPDVRDIRFICSGFSKWSGRTLLAFLIAALITLYFLSRNQMWGGLGGW